MGVFCSLESVGIVIFAELFFPLILPCVVQSESTVTHRLVWLQGKAIQATLSKRGVSGRLQAS